MNRKELKEEERRIRILRKQGRDEKYIQSWIRGWRMCRKVAERSTT